MCALSECDGYTRAERMNGIERESSVKHPDRRYVCNQCQTEDVWRAPWLSIRQKDGQFLHFCGNHCWHAYCGNGVPWKIGGKPL